MDQPIRSQRQRAKQDEAEAQLQQLLPPMTPEERKQKLVRSLAKDDGIPHDESMVTQDESAATQDEFVASRDEIAMMQDTIQNEIPTTQHELGMTQDEKAMGQDAPQDELAVAKDA